MKKLLLIFLYLPMIVLGQFNHQNGYFVTNEGNWGVGNGSLSYIDENNQVTNNVFSSINSFSLGDIVNSMSIIDSLGYIVVNNSSKIEIANINSMTHIATISGLLSPRYILQVSANKAYVTDWGISGIHVIDLNTNSIISTISTGQGPEKMLLKDNKAYICNVGGYGLDNTVSVIDTQNDTLITNVIVGDKPNSIVEDTNGNIWVLAGGYTEYDPNWNIVSETPGELTTINSLTDSVVGSFLFVVGDHPQDLIIDDNGSTLYLSNGSWSRSVYSFNIYNNTLSTNPIINKSFYSLGFNNNHIYGTDVLDYVQNGWTYKYNTNGQVIDSIEVGVIPGGYCFNLTVPGCTDSTALNFNSLATVDDGSCLYCDLTTIINQSAPSSNSSCDGFILATSISSVSISTYSCTNSQGSLISTNNFSANLCADGYIYTVSDSLGCTTIDTILLGDIYGCTDSLAFNYLWAANIDDGSCIPTILGCTDSLALNYDSLANTDDGSCCVIDNLLEQVGSTLYGGWYAYSGRAVSLSNDGNTLAVGDPNFTPVGGKVKLFTKISDPISGISSWSQVGSSINGDNPSDQFGSSISLSADGNIVAIGAPSATVNNGPGPAGKVKLFTKISDPISGISSWSQIGQTLQGSNGDRFGQSLSLSADGNKIVIGAPYNDDTGYNFGQMKVFENISGYWNLSAVFNGNGWNGRMGSSVSINANGNIVASIYEYEVKVLINNSGTWNQMGNDILSSYYFRNYNYTSSISLDDSGTTIVVGNPGNGFGFADIFKFNSNSWSIDGVIPNFSSGSNTGQSVSLSNDGNTVAIGAPYSSNFGNQAGEVRLYTRISTPNIGTYTWTQKGQSLSSNRNDSYSGYSVSIAENGKSVAFGSPEYYYGNPGSAQVFRFENNCAGCTDSFALNYDSTMQYDDGSCIYPSGCTDPTAYNYDSTAVYNDGSCLYCDLSNNFLVNNNTSGNCNGFIVANSSSSNSPISYLWSNGSTQNNIIGLCAGVYSVTITDNVGCTLQDTIYMNIIVGCTDSTALNYDPNATVDDGSCTYSSNCTSPKPTGLYAYDVIDTRAKIGWDNMNDPNCMVWKYFVRYREVGTSGWTTKSAGVGNGLCNFGLNTVTKQLLNLTPSTTYEFRMKAFYCGGTSSNYSTPFQFTTANPCPDMINLTTTTFNGNQSKVRFNWDTTGAYTFARILLRVDTVGANWQTAGGFGVYYPTFFVNKFGLQSGESYRAQGRTFCDSNITAYRSPTWTAPIFWTQPGTIRFGGGSSINNLDVYPNPSRDVFNISFNSDKRQDLSIRILNLVGAEVYREDRQEFVGEYIKQISLDNYGKGIYFLEIQTPKGIVNKKLILQ